MSFETQKYTAPMRLGLPTLIAAGLLAAAVAFDARRASADDLIVKYDQSQILRLPRPAADIIIGNPSIADVSVQGGNLLVITGKTFGITNIIALDAERNVIQDQRVVVEREDTKVVSLFKGASRETYNCTTQCNTMITVGDDAKFFDGISKSANTKTRFSEGSSQGDAGQQ